MKESPTVLELGIATSYKGWVCTLIRPGDETMFLKTV
jgi:hypothetical protein